MSGPLAITIVWFLTDWWVASYLRKNATAHWVGYERTSCFVGIVVFGSWVLFGDLVFIADSLLITYVLTQVAGLVMPREQMLKRALGLD